MAAVLIKDVALHAGVSLATITRVVNKQGYVSAETRKRVENSIETLGYVPNHMARALKNNRTGVIGNMMSLEADNPFCAKISLALKNAAAEYSYQILPVYSEEDKHREEHLIRELVGRMVEGIIFTGIIKSNRKVIKTVLSGHRPIVMIERPLNIPGTDKILIDDFSGAALAARRFLEFGHRVCGFIGRDTATGTVEAKRFDGFKQTLEENGLSLPGKNAGFVQGYGAKFAYDAMEKIIKKAGKNLPTAFFITSDVLVCGAMQYLYQAGLRVPEDISIIGNDNTLSVLCSPPVTTIAIPYEEIGRTALSMLWERREQHRGTDRTVTLKPFLLERESVADLR
ncbi:MAG: LacI family transcriptional regulator [Treponema sp.]|jgi:LacI family transcriptional regulator|nr:LacI family transcriptional regulator [Treponema sp.]